MESSNTNNLAKLVVFFLLLFVFTIWLAFNASAIIPSPVGHWKFNNDYTDAKNLNNLSAGGSGNTFTTTTKKLGSHAINFSGAGYAQDLSTSSLGTGDINLSWAYWIYLETNTTFLTMAGRGTYNTNLMYSMGGNFHTTDILFADEFSDQVTFNTGINTHVWTHIVYTYNAANDTSTLYKNGVLIGSQAHASGLNIANDDLRIGARIGGSPAGFVDGCMDDVRYYEAVLNQTEIDLIYNSGVGTEEDQPTGATPTTDLYFSITDDFNGSTINDFSINITWQNGTTQLENTVNGSIPLLNASQADTSLNVTFYGMTNYFNKTLLNEPITANTTNTIAPTTYQAVARLVATEKITNNTLSGVTFYIGSKSGTEFNITAGSHSVTAVKEGYFNLTGLITVAAFSNQTYTLEGMYSTIANFTAYNAITNDSITSFTISTDFGEEVSTTNGTVFINVINNTNYTFNITSPGAFTSKLNLTFKANASTYNINTSLYTFNSIRFNIFNESSLEALTQAVTVHTISNLTTFSNITSTGFIVIDLLEPNSYEIRFESSGFNPRSLFLTVTNDSTQNITIYMTENTTTELQTIEVLDTSNSPIEGAVVWLQKELINESTQWITIQEAQTDYNGKTTVWVERDVTVFYRFAVIYEGEARPIQPSGNLFTGKTTFIPGVTETIQLIVDLEADPQEYLLDNQGISYTCNITNITARCDIIDGRNAITGAKMVIEAAYINETLNYETVATINFTGSSGFLEYNLTEINNSIWRVSAYAIYEDSERLIWQDIKRFAADVIINKNVGLLYAVLILAVISAITVTWGALPSGLVTFAALIPLTYLKLIALPVGVITGLLALVIIFFFRKRKGELD